jgi:hypothetical protein
MVESEVERNPVQFCLSGQAERHPASAEYVIDYGRDAGKQVNRLWVNRFVERSVERFTFRQVFPMVTDEGQAVGRPLCLDLLA